MRGAGSCALLEILHFSHVIENKKARRSGHLSRRDEDYIAMQTVYGVASSTVPVAIAATAAA